MNYKRIIDGLEEGILAMRQSQVSEQEMRRRLNRFKTFNYKNLSEDEVFWTLTYVMFFNIGRKASMIEKKLPLFKEYLYGYRRVANLTDSELDRVTEKIGFRLQGWRCRQLAKIYRNIIEVHGSFSRYLDESFGIKDINCSLNQLNQFYNDLIRRFQGNGIGETARWHFTTELGFYSLKPDAVIKRIFYRLGLINNEDDNIATIEIGRDISASLNIPIRYIDILFVKFGQEGSSDLLGTRDGICLSKRPKCKICPLSEICHYEDRHITLDNSTNDNKKHRSYTTEDRQVVKNIPSMLDDRLYLPREYIESKYFKSYSAECQYLIKHLIDTLLDKDMSFYIQKRKNNDFILIPSMKINAKTNKNVATIWTFRSNIRKRIMPEDPESYSSISSIDEIIGKIHQKYLEIK